MTFRRAFPAPTPTQRRWLELGVLGVALWRVVGVRWTPIVSDDSVGYLTRARAPLGTGFVVDGYRQLGYPLWLWMVDHVASPLGLDRLFGIVVAQRLLLVAAVVALWWVLRLWSAPVLWFVTSATTVVLTNFVLNEGILISLAMLAVAGLLGAASVVAPLTGVRPASRPGRWLVFAMVVVTAMTVLKLHYVLLGLPILPAMWALQVRGLRLKPLIAAGGAMAVLLGTMVVGQTLENSREYHDPTPVSEQAHAQWWGAYHAVFRISPEVAQRPEVQRYKGSGFASFYFPLIENEPDYRVRRELTRHRIDELFEAAGTTRGREHRASFLGGLIGGRHDDLTYYFPPVLSDRDGSGLTENWVAQQQGVDAAIERFNGGRTPADIAPGVVLGGGQRLGGDLSWLYPDLAMAGLVTALLGIRLGGRERWIGPVAGLAQIGGAALLATGFIDIKRYLAPYVVTSLCVGLWALAARAHRSAAVAVPSRGGRQPGPEPVATCGGDPLGQPVGIHGAQGT